MSPTRYWLKPRFKEVQERSLYQYRVPTRLKPKFKEVQERSQYQDRVPTRLKPRFKEVPERSLYQYSVPQIAAGLEALSLLLTVTA